MPKINIDVSVANTTDSIAPGYDPDALMRIWNYPEVFLGYGEGYGRFVPNIDDLIIDTSVNPVSWYKVTDIDPATLMVTLADVQMVASQNLINDSEFILGPRYEITTVAKRVYLDTSVTPHVLSVDERIFFGGSDTTHVKIFKGTNISESGKVVASIYDPSGTWLTNNIPLELAATDSHENHTIKTVAVCYTNEKMKDGELATIVSYSAEGHVRQIVQVLVLNTALSRSVSSPKKYVADITLETPFKSTTDEYLIEFPINVPVEGLGLRGTVWYSTGEKRTLPIDNNKFKVMGLSQFVSTVTNQRFDVTLGYSLSPEEVAYTSGVTVDGKHVTKTYTVNTIAQDGMYSVKLFCYPVWDTATNTYSLRWYLFTLDRSLYYPVTHLIKYNPVSGPLDPSNYVSLQNLSVTIDLSKINPVFKPYLHTQVVGITLLEPGTSRTTNWTVRYEGHQVAPYGVGLFCRATWIDATATKINLSSDITQFSDWLERVYKNTKPLYDASREMEAPVPTHFTVITETSENEYPIELWNEDIVTGSGVIDSGTVFIRFIKRIEETNLQLAIAAMSVFKVN